jgi:hypothetical protein
MASKTMGIVVVATFAASAAEVLPATRTFTRRRTKSAASSGSRSNRPSAHRGSIATFRPGTKPVSFSARSNAAAPFAEVPGEPPLKTPMTGINACCARAASGHAAAPPSSVMNSRRRRQILIWPSCAREPYQTTIARPKVCGPYVQTGRSAEAFESPVTDPDSDPAKCPKRTIPQRPGRLTVDGRWPAFAATHEICRQLGQSVTSAKTAARV